MTSTSFQPPGARTRKLDRCPHGLALDARQRDRGDLLVVGVEEVEPAGPGQARAVDAEQPFGGVVGPNEPGRGIDHDDRVREPDGNVEQSPRFDHQDSIGCGGPRP